MDISMTASAHLGPGNVCATKINDYTFMFRSGNARLTLTFTRDGNMVTTSEYQSALVKRVGVQATRQEMIEFSKRLVDNLAVEPYP